MFKYKRLLILKEVNLSLTQSCLLQIEIWAVDGFLYLNYFKMMQKPDGGLCVRISTKNTSRKLIFILTDGS